MSQALNRVAAARKSCIDHGIKFTASQQNSPSALENLVSEKKRTVFEESLPKGYKWLEILPVKSNKRKKDNNGNSEPSLKSIYIRTNSKNTKYVVCNKGLIYVDDIINPSFKVADHKTMKAMYVLPVTSTTWNFSDELQSTVKPDTYLLKTESKSDANSVVSQINNNNSADMDISPEILPNNLTRAPTISSQNNTNLSSNPVTTLSSVPPVIKNPKRNGRILSIGNGAYMHIKPELPNAVNDAQAIRDYFSKTLKYKATFKSTVKVDQQTTTIDYNKPEQFHNIKEEKELLKLITAFAESIKSDEMVVFYYAGHSLEGRHGNILATIDAASNLIPAPTEDEDKKQINDHLETKLSVQRIHDIFREACKKNLIDKNKKGPKGFLFLIDGCRVYTGGITARAPNNNTNSNPNPAPIPGPEPAIKSHGIDTIYSFSCEPGSEALDSSRQQPNQGPYVHSLIKALNEKLNEVLDISKLLRRCCHLTKEDTFDPTLKTYQRPWFHESVAADNFNL
jgi:hypothetical protein